MLVLTRKSGESLHIGDDIVITVIEVRRGQVKIGVEAPKSIKVYRKELLDKIKQENIEALRTKNNGLSDLAQQLLKKKK